MSANPSDLRFYGSASMPDVDGATTGGAVDFTKKISFSDVSPSGLVDYVSSSASDTASVITITGRDGTGVQASENKTLTGQTAVAGTATFERLMKGVVSGTAPVGDVAAISHTKVISAHTAQTGSANSTGNQPALMKLASGDKASVAVGQIIRCTNNLPAGVQYQLREIISVDAGYGADVVAVNRDWGTVPTSATTYDVHQGFLFELAPNRIVEVRRPFYNVASDVIGGSARTFYEKIFAVNNNTGTAVTTASILKQVDPSAGTLGFALTNALNDTATVANRQTLPATGIGAFNTSAAPQTTAVPSPANLPSGAAPNAAGAQGVWLSLLLAAGLSAAKTSLTMRATGQST
jgi:hypothetical protein